MLTTPILQPVPVADLSALERVLPVLGGTVTEVLERHLGERLRTVILEQRSNLSSEPIPLLDLQVDSPVLERHVLLRGETTSTPVLYAESRIALEHLDEYVKEGLLATDQPIGRLIREHRMETFRELLASERASFPHLARVFGLAPRTPLLARTYRMSSGGRPVMLIAEWFAC